MVLLNDKVKDNYLMEDYRKEIGEGVQYDLLVNLITNTSSKISIDGLTEYEGIEAVLIDLRLSKVYHFDNNFVKVKSVHQENKFRLLLGTNNFIQDQIKNLLPTEFVLYQNYPNPFNPNTVIRFALPNKAKVELKVYSILGEEVTTLINNKFMNAGNYEVEFEASNIASGIYFYRIIADSFTDVKKMVLVK